MHCIRRAAFRALTSTPSKATSSPIRSFSRLIERRPEVSICSRYNSPLLRRWLADDATATQLESEAEPSTSESEPPKTEEQAAEAVASTPTEQESFQPETATEELSGIDKALGAGQAAASKVADTLRDAASTATSTLGEGEAKPNTVYVGNLFFDVRSEDLNREFAKAGAVKSARVISDARGLSKGFGYVEYETPEEAATAMQMFNLQNFEGRRIAVQLAHGPRPRPDRRSGTQDREPGTPSKTLFIGNMSFDMSDKDLNNLFREVKNVTDVRVAIDRRTGQPRGFAHADFTDVESAVSAAENLRGKMICGRVLRVDFSQSTGRASA